MRAYHSGIDYWTVLDDISGYEYDVSAPDQEGYRRVTNCGTKSAPGKYAREKVLAAVEARRRELETDWTALNHQPRA